MPHDPAFFVRRHPASGRNRLFVGENAAGSAILIKQLMSPAAFRRELNSRYVSSALAPSICFAIEDEAVVAYSAFPGSASVQDIARDDIAKAIEELAKLGRALATLHSATRDAGPADIDEVLPPIQPFPITLFVHLSDAGRELIRLVQERPRLVAAYREARLASPDSFIHADLKRDNILITRHGPVLVDFEVSGQGPALVDIGAIVASMIMLWTDQLPFDAEQTPDEWTRNSAVEFSLVARGTRQLLDEYASTAVETMAIGDVPRFAAAWIVGRCLAEAARVRRLRPRHLARLVVAENLVVNPERSLPIW